jgi:hypothetical protein
LSRFVTGEFSHSRLALTFRDQKLVLVEELPKRRGRNLSGSSSRVAASAQDADLPERMAVACERCDVVGGEVGCSRIGSSTGEA